MKGSQVGDTELMSCFTNMMLFQGSLHYLFGGHQTMRIYGKFDGFPINSALLGLVI